MSKYKDKKPSMIEFTKKYANNDQACEEFFLGNFIDFPCQVYHLMYKSVCHLKLRISIVYL